MKNKSFVKYVIYSAAGFIILLAATITAKLTREYTGVLRSLPYVFIGIGAGIFGQNIGTVFNIMAMKKDPSLAKRIEIETKDERNVEIRNKAKSKAYDLMVKVFGALLLALALMQTDFSVLVAFVISYIFIMCSTIYYTNKLSKEL